MTEQDNIDTEFVMMPIHPGEHLADIMEDLTAADVAAKTGLAEQSILDLLAGKTPVTAKIAAGLARGLKISEEFWEGLQSDYEADCVEYEITEIMDKAKNGPVAVEHAEVERQKTLLAFLSRTESTDMVGSVNAQKLVYRIIHEADTAGTYVPEFDFRIHKHGPEDRSITETLDRMADEGLVSVKNKTEFSRRRYHLTDKGRKFGNILFSNLPAELQDKVTDVVEWAMSFKSLTEFKNDFYRRYPETQPV